MVVARCSQPLGKANHQRTQLRILSQDVSNLLQRAKAVQHPEIGQRHADLRLVVIVFVIPAAGVEANALGVLARKNHGEPVPT